MHEQKTLVVRNPTKPTMERLPCRLTRDEKLARMDKRMALERTREQIDAEIAAHKARVKALVTGLLDDRGEVDADMRQLREEILAGVEVRLVECELLEDHAEGAIYVFRLDTGEVVQRRDMAPHEREQPELPLDEVVTRTVDIPEHVESVQRFDSDPPGVTDADEDPDDGGDEGGAPTSTYGHEHTYNEGTCAVCGDVDEDYEAASDEPVKPTRRKRGEGKKGRGYDDRGAEAGAH